MSLYKFEVTKEEEAMLKRISEDTGKSVEEVIKDLITECHEKIHGKQKED